MASIVLAEDDVHIIRVVSMWLKQHGHQVLEAANGRAALQLVLAHKPDLLITDVNMPVMDGVQLVKACAAEHLPKVGVVMLTSRCDQADIIDSLQGAISGLSSQAVQSVAVGVGSGESTQTRSRNTGYGDLFREVSACPCRTTWKRAGAQRLHRPRAGRPTT